MKTNTLYALALILMISQHASAQTFTFDFSNDEQLFHGGVSDFSVGQSDQHQFTFANLPLPAPLNTGRNGQFISGFNPSDDLFMYMKRKIIGLQPNTTYKVSFVVDFASIYPTNAFGVGGPPGEGVTMKAGVTLIEPDTIIIDKGGPYVAMNIDKGNQSIPGADMDTIGHVGVSDTTTVYTIKTNDNVGHPFTFTSDHTGEAWIIIGTDSGYESETALYYTSVTVDFTISTSTEDLLDPNDVLVYPNPSSGSVFLSSSIGDFEMIRIYDMAGRLFRSYLTRTSNVSFMLPRSDYLIKIKIGNATVVKRLIVQ